MASACQISISASAIGLPAAAETLQRVVAAARIGWMGVAAHGVSLPDLDQRVGDRVAGTVEYAALDTDALALNIAFGHLAAGQAAQVLLVTVLFRCQTISEIWPDRLR